MKKRITCLLLTLIMLVSLVPAASLTASAASLSVSEAAITVLKKMTLFKSECYQVANTQEFRIGYGTVCNESGHDVNAKGVIQKGHKTHTISQTAADTALRNALKEIDKKVNSFASSNGLSLKQNQHDALVIFSFDSGTAWMDGNGVVKTAIVNGANSNELLNAMNEWTYKTDLNRRKVEVNMYMNNVYSNVVPSSYAQVTYNANDGTMAQGSPYTMLFDTTTAVAHIPTPTKSNYTFVGWYLSASGKQPGAAEDLQWVPNLNYLCAGHTLYALWQKNGEDNSNTAGVAVNYTLAKSQLASKTMYNRPNLKASDIKETGKVTADKVTVLRDYIGTDGTRWAKLGDWQWVIVKAGSNGISSGGTDIDVTVTVTNSYVNSRVNATIHSATNGSYKQGAQLRIINTAQADGFLWGQVAKSADDDTPICWVALMYTNWNSVKDEGTSGNGSSTNSKAIAQATITNNGYVNVRSDAGTDNKIVGSLAKNETVEVYEIKTVNGHQWGRTTAGWFCMTYASVTMLTTNSTNNIISDAGALDYAFTGRVNAKFTPHVQAGYNTNITGDTVEVGTSVTLTNMVMVDEMVEGSYVKETWGKIVWRVDTDNDGKADTNKTGWIPVDNPLTVVGIYLSIDTARFQAVSNVTIRKDADSGADAVFTMTAGVEFEVFEIKLVGENIWGYTGDLTEVVGKDNTEYGSYSYSGWVNLASKYVKRVNAPTIEGDKTNHNTGKVATVINTDSVRVRNYGSTSGKVIGSLSRGSTVAVWETNEDGDWFKIDTNKNGTYDYEEDGWVYGDYLNITEASTGSSSGSDSSNGTTNSSSGTGIVANTYSGVNVRASAGISGTFVCKLLPGTQVEILETTTVGAAKWGRVAQGWVCMDYIAMISYDDIPGNSSGTTNTSNGTAVDSLDKVDKTTTTAVYTGKINSEVSSDVYVYATPALKTDELEEREIVNVLKAGDPVTMYELLTVTETYQEIDKDDKINETDPADQQGGGTTITKTVTSYWARVNGGYIYDPEHNLTLDALDEKVHTLTGSDTLNVRENASINSNAIDDAKLKKGDQVSVTALKIEKDKVWGRIKLDDNAAYNYGWIRLDYMSEGAYYVNQTTTNNNNNTGTASTPVIGSTGNTGTAGIANNTSGYKYTGKVINTDSVNVRTYASCNDATSPITTTLKRGASLVIYETTTAENMAWGRCDAGWVYLYYVDLTPSGGSAIDARVVYNDNTIVYTDTNCSEVAGTYARMSVIDIYEVVGSMVRTDLGWVNTSDLL